MEIDSNLISIITPTFNREKTLLPAVESVLAQSWKHWELLIIDDGSTDQTREVLSEYLQDSRIHYYYQENQGQSIARNQGLKRARGALVCFLDSDDLWTTSKLEHQYKIMAESPDVDLVHGDEITIDESCTEVTRKNMRRYSGHISRWLLADNSVSINTVMARRHCFDQMGGFSGRYGVADDYDIWLRFSARYNFLYVPEFFGYYRVMPDQISTDKERRFLANERIIKDFIEQFPSALKPQELRRGLSRFYCRKARYFAQTGRIRVAWSAIGQALRLSPYDIVVWRSLYRVMFPFQASNQEMRSTR